MALFRKHQTSSAYLKMGIMGFQGSGKTYTATQTAIGLVNMMRQKDMKQGSKPVYFLDTETGVDWVAPQLEKAGIELFDFKTRAFKDLREAVREAEAGGSILLIDSITAFWNELTESYAKQKNRTRGLEFQDWAYLKRTWRLFTDDFINSDLHIIMCGRAGYEYDFFENDSGKKELEKTGVKMKAEGEMGYEPSLLVYMQRHTDPDTAKVTRTATVMKDRSTVLDGKVINNPTFQSFAPHIQFLNLGGKQQGIDTTRTSEAMIPRDAPRDKIAMRKEIVAEEIQSAIVYHIPGQTGADKQRKTDLLKKHFETTSWTKIEKDMSLERMREGYNTLHQELFGEPSHYAEQAAVLAQMEKDFEDDQIPDFPLKTPLPEELDHFGLPALATTERPATGSTTPRTLSVEGATPSILAAE